MLCTMKIAVHICSSVAEVVKPKKVFVQHLETVTDSETTIDIIHSFFVSFLTSSSSLLVFVCL